MESILRLGYLIAIPNNQIAVIKQKNSWFASHKYQKNGK